MAETYTIELGVSTNKVGSETVDVVNLIEYGYTDERWDALPTIEQYKLIDSWVEEYVWNNIENWGDIKRG